MNIVIINITTIIVIITNILFIPIIISIVLVVVIYLSIILITCRPLMLTIGKMFSSDTVVNISTAKSSRLYLITMMMVMLVVVVVTGGTNTNIEIKIHILSDHIYNHCHVYHWMLLRGSSEMCKIHTQW